MIANPVIKKSGGGQVYSITDNSGFGFPKSAAAGAWVQTLADGPLQLYTIKDSSGAAIPRNQSGTTAVQIAFIMPAANVTISLVEAATDPGGDDIIIAS